MTTIAAVVVRAIAQMYTTSAAFASKAAYG